MCFAYTLVSDEWVELEVVFFSCVQSGFLMKQEERANSEQEGADNGKDSSCSRNEVLKGYKEKSGSEGLKVKKE